MEQIKIYPELRKDRIDARGMTHICIRIDIGGNRAGTEQLPYKIHYKNWEPVTKRVTEKEIEWELVNLMIDNRINYFKNYVLRRQTFGLPVTKDILARLTRSGSAPDCFYQYAEHVLESKRLKDGQGYNAETKRRYRDEIKKLMQFKPILQFNQIDVRLLTEYRNWLINTYTLKDGSKLHTNGPWNAFKFIRMVYNEALREQVVLAESNPFKNFKVGTYETDYDKIKYLEREEVDELQKVMEGNTCLPELTRRIGWRFLSMCVCGLRISDAMLLDAAFFNDAGDLSFKPQKTKRHGNQAQIPIVSDRQRLYLQKTLSLPLPETNPKTFRTTFNIHLKILAATAGININLTSHVGRHTMGSFLVDAGVEKRSAMAMLGVKSEKVIETYMHLKESKLKSEANKLKNVF